MSLSELPTELDQQVIEYIDNAQDLSSMTQVSKYYWELAEPSLYRHLDLQRDDFVDVCRLLDTIIRRPILAECIESITYSNCCRESRKSSHRALLWGNGYDLGMDEYYLLDKHRSVIREAVAWAYSDDVERKEVDSWMRRIFMREFKKVVVLMLCVVSYKTQRVLVAYPTVRAACRTKRFTFEEA